MFKEKDMENQQTFRKHSDGNWYDEGWDFMLEFKQGKANLYSHSEVDGEIEFIKDIWDLEDLEETYNLLTKTYHEDF